MKQKVYFKTFGCRTNLFDSQVMMTHLQDYDVTLNEDEADMIVINSCTVTNGADSNVRHYIKQAEQRDVKIFLTGCGTHTKGASLFEQNRVFGVFGQSEKEKINTLLKTSSRFFDPGNLDHIDRTLVSDFVGKSRAFIKVQEGCSFRCSYCIIPYVRGDTRSMHEADILAQVHALAENGFGEFILTGTNVGSYGQGEERSLVSLMRKMSQIRGVRRIRIGSLEPIQITPEFKELLTEPWLEKHLHIAIQHSAPQMLKQMNRRNRVESDRALFHELSDLGFALGTDFIVGHPGETEAIWQEAWKNLETLPLTHVHAFSYSKRDGTPSATMKEEVPGDVAKSRLQALEQLVAEKNEAFRNQYASTPLEVLIESRKGDHYYGLDQFFNPVHLYADDDLTGEWLTLSEYTVTKEANHAKL